MPAEPASKSLYVDRTYRLAISIDVLGHSRLGKAQLLRETRFIENGFVARVRAVGVVYWSAFTSITACL